MHALAIVLLGAAGILWNTDPHLRPWIDGAMWLLAWGLCFRAGTVVDGWIVDLGNRPPRYARGRSPSSIPRALR